MINKQYSNSQDSWNLNFSYGWSNLSASLISLLLLPLMLFEGAGSFDGVLFIVEKSIAFDIITPLFPLLAPDDNLYEFSLVWNEGELVMQ